MQSQHNPQSSVNQDHYVHTLQDACRKTGIVYKPIPADDCWYRADIDNDPRGHDDASIKLFADGRGGCVHNWKTDSLLVFFHHKGDSLTQEVLDACRDDVERELSARRAECRKKAAHMWDNTTCALDNHPYLVRKAVPAYGCLHVDRRGRLLVPALDNDDVLHGLQTIDRDGTKRFLLGSDITAHYCLIAKTLYGGMFIDANPDGPLCIAEGYATAASIHKATEWEVAVAFGEGNLLAVAQALRVKYRDRRIILCADWDGTPDYPGLVAAREAAAAVGRRLAVPDFGSNRPDGATDFNDMHRLRSLEAVRHFVMNTKLFVEAVKNATKDIEVIIERADTIEPENYEWLWKYWLACSKLHVLAGPKGTAKSTIAFTLAAVITKGGEWPDGTPCPQGDVLLWSGEDGAGDTVMPRFLAAGGDPTHLHIVRRSRDKQGERPFDPATDLPALIAKMRKIPNLRLVDIDPVVSVVLGDSHRNTEVRRALQPLVNLAAEIDTAVLGISHFSKGSAGRDPTERVVDSLAFAAVPRVVMAAVKMNDERRFFCRTDSNIGPSDGGWEFEIERTTVPGKAGPVNTTQVLWGDALEGSVRDLLAQAEVSNAPKRKTAKEFLRGHTFQWSNGGKGNRGPCGGGGVLMANGRAGKKGPRDSVQA